MYGPSLAIRATANGTIYPGTAHVMGVNLVAGTSVTIYKGTAATAANKIGFTNTLGAIYELPCVEATNGIHVVFAGGSPEAIIYYK
jgi:hypothetical protein